MTESLQALLIQGSHRVFNKDACLLPGWLRFFFPPLKQPLSGAPLGQLCMYLPLGRYLRTNAMVAVSHLLGKRVICPDSELQGQEAQTHTLFWKCGSRSIQQYNIKNEEVDCLWKLHSTVLKKSLLKIKMQRLCSYFLEWVALLSGAVGWSKRTGLCGEHFPSIS